MAKKIRANAFNTGVAAEYFILSQLYRMGIEAYISQGNKKAIDIRIIQEDGRAIFLDVKAVRGYSSLVVNNVIPKENHYIVFVIYNDNFEAIEFFPEIYIVPSKELKKITNNYKKEKRVLKGNLQKNSYKNNWNFLFGL